MQTITVADTPAQQWRNGGGLTRVLASGQAARAPLSATSPGDFDWRISVAEIVADGPFSTFAGIDRHALLLSQGAVELAGPAGAVMARTLVPVSFPGELELQSQRLPGTAAARLLNLMVRRTRLRGEIVVIGQPCAIDDAFAWVLLPLTGSWQVRSDGHATQAMPGQAVVGQAAMQVAPFDASSHAALALVRTARSPSPF